MTILTEPVANIAGAEDDWAEVSFTVERIRESHDGTRIVTTEIVTVTPIDGVVTTPNLDPGPAVVRIGGEEYRITIPESSVPLRLWPIIDAVAEPSPSHETGFVRNGGGIARSQVLSAEAYAAIVTPDPETLYLIPAE